MKDKNSVIVAVGLIVMVAIAGLTVYGINDYTKQFVKATDAVNALMLQQKDMLIKKLVKKLDSIERELGSLKEKISGIAEDVKK